MGGISVWPDADGDGYGADGGETSACEVVAGYVAIDGDCADGDPAIHPDAAEVCDDADVDEDCDGAVEDDDPDVAYVPGADVAWPDLDGDGFGDGQAPGNRCDLAVGWVLDAQDCDDGDAAVKSSSSVVPSQSSSSHPSTGATARCTSSRRGSRGR